MILAYHFNRFSFVQWRNNNTWMSNGPLIKSSDIKHFFIFISLLKHLNIETTSNDDIQKNVIDFFFESKQTNWKSRIEKSKKNIQNPASERRDELNKSNLIEKTKWNPKIFFYLISIFHFLLLLLLKINMSKTSNIKIFCFFFGKKIWNFSNQIKKNVQILPDFF